jgi:xanthine dehydrogenase iron-sulfur cluster and FAD-binding subunit A
MPNGGFAVHDRSGTCGSVHPDGSDADISLTVDGEQRRLTVDTRTTLLDALRERLGNASPKKGCDHGQCGACTGEIGTTGTAAAVVNAVHRATGVRVRDLPVTLDKVLPALP